MRRENDTSDTTFDLKIIKPFIYLWHVTLIKVIHMSKMYGIIKKCYISEFSGVKRTIYESLKWLLNAIKKLAIVGIAITLRVE